MKLWGIGLGVMLAVSTSGDISDFSTSEPPQAITENCFNFNSLHYNSCLAQVNSLEVQAEQLYQQGKFKESISLLQQAIENYTTNGEGLRAVQGLRNLALVYLQLQDWQNSESAIATSLTLLEQLQETKETQQLTASVLEVKGQLKLSKGQPQKALETWKEASNIYGDLNQISGLTRTKINQAQALQAMGFYSQALKTLTAVGEQLETQPDTVLKAKALQSLGDVLRGVGQFEESLKLLEKSVNIATEFNATEEQAIALIGLGNTQRSIAERNWRLNFNESEPLPLQRRKRQIYLDSLQVPFNSYQQAADITSLSLTKIQAQLNQLNLLISSEQPEKIAEIINNLQQLLQQLPPSRAGIYAQINFAQNLIELNSETNFQVPDLENILENTVKIIQNSIAQAQQIEDQDAEARALGMLGKLYENNQQFPLAEKLTREAVSQVSAYNNPEIAYKLFWQLGRIYKAQGKLNEAILTYTQAVNILQSLRSDIVAISSEVQFNFREQVEPIYRELVDLLLVADATPENLQQARQVIEALQLAELDNFFRDACLDAQPYDIDQLDKTAAVFYTIILEDRIEVILALPEQPLVRYTTKLPQSQVELTLKTMVEEITQPSKRQFLQNFLTVSQQAYDWLIRPVEEQLEASNVETLVFVPDGRLRNISLASLHDGQQYLVEKYKIALAPSLQLIDPKPLARQQAQILTGGLSEARQGFIALPSVELELQQIQKQVGSKVLLNQSFTEPEFATEVTNLPYSVVHIATHGKFSSNLKETYILTWDERIDIEELRQLLTANIEQTGPIELLVLSACTTATGDERAGLGLAGVAVRAGARSTVASLWAVNDKATADLMTTFYQELSNPNLTKAEALRRAQVSILQQQNYAHPYFWAAFVLVGNWL
ncbi:MAG: CHAT domain-containing protein [Lyngbya sp.]|nr:CHAT domain-containing protein [Lyngbya sp.]